MEDPNLWRDAILEIVHTLKVIKKVSKKAIEEVMKMLKKRLST